MPPSALDGAGSSPSASFLGSISMRLDSPVGRKTPNAVQIDFLGAGSLRGPALSGRLSDCAGSVQVGADGVGYLRLEGPVQSSACPTLLQASGRCDFGPGGHDLADSGKLPRVAATLTARLLSSQEGCAALNRCLAVAVGQIDLSRGTLDLDLFSMAPASSMTAAAPPRAGSLP